MLNINSKVSAPEFSTHEQLAARVIWLESQYAALHSQVSGYLHGEDWTHWQKYNEPKFAPNVALRQASNTNIGRHDAAPTIDWKESLP